jgi:hypothetical protein
MDEVPNSALPGSPLGRIGEEEILSRVQARALQDRAHHVSGGARIGGRFEDDELAGPQPGRDRLSRALDEGEVRLAVLSERGWHADEDRVDFGQPVEIGGRREQPALDQVRDNCGCDLADVGAARIERVDLRRVDVEPDYAEAPLAGRPREGQPDIAEPDDAEPSVLDLARAMKASAAGEAARRPPSISRRTWPGSAGPRSCR